MRLSAGYFIGSCLGFTASKIRYFLDKQEKKCLLLQKPFRTKATPVSTILAGTTFRKTGQKSQKGAY